MMEIGFGRGVVGFALGRITRIRGIRISSGGVIGVIGGVGVIGKAMRISGVEGHRSGDGGRRSLLTREGFGLESGEELALLIG